MKNYRGKFKWEKNGRDWIQRKSPWVGDPDPGEPPNHFCLPAYHEDAGGSGDDGDDGDVDDGGDRDNDDDDDDDEDDMMMM